MARAKNTHAVIIMTTNGEAVAIHGNAHQQTSWMHTAIDSGASGREETTNGVGTVTIQKMAVRITQMQKNEQKANPQDEPWVRGK